MSTYEVGKTGDEIEIGQYRRIDKGPLRATFSLVIYYKEQARQDKTIDCKYFVSGDKQWFTFPQKEVKYTDGRKTEYIPYRTFGDKQYFQQLKDTVVAALAIQEGKNEENRPTKTSPRSLHSGSPDYWEEAPF
jgi:hypothetical protein